jgi:two-component system, NtrC family, nitrogen regulation response regulator NtrX
VDVSGSARILLIDDDPAVLRGVGGMLRDEGYLVVLARNVAEAERCLADAGSPCDLMVLDLRMPGESGLELLGRLPRPLAPPVVVLSGEASPTDAVTAMRLGAADFVEKPPSTDRLLTSIRNALAMAQLTEERAELRRALASPDDLVGQSPSLAALRELIARVGPSEALVLIQGETGAGKERVARALHAASGRQGRFVAINCAAIPATLLESELFGHERGAFTGASNRRQGRFEQAQGGTLLLDEIGDMPLDLQAKLLRVLETREIERLGGSRAVPIDCRILAATHRDLRKAVSEGTFRQDLYFRLAVFPLRMPPLRERREDILPLLQTFVRELGGAATTVAVTPDGMAALAAHPFPGNVRELRNFAERLILLRGRGPLLVDAAATAVLTLGDPLPPEDAAGGSGETPPIARLGQKGYRALVDDFERALLRAALERTGANVAAAARLLKVDRGNLYRRIQALGLAAMGEGDPEGEPDPPAM